MPDQPENPQDDSPQSRPPIDPSFSAAAPPPPPGYPPAYFAPPPGRPVGGVITKVATSLIATVFISSIVLNIYFAIIFSRQVSLAPVVEQTHRAGETTERIVILPVTGVINDDTSTFVREAMQSLEDDPPAALVLRVNSGGGTVGASDRIWHYLDAFRASHPDIKIVASYGSYAASGGYYVSALADHIYAEPTCITGSIGVMGQLFTFEGLLEKIGVEPITMIATDSPDKDRANDITRAWTQQDRQVVQTLLDSAYDRFLEVVVAGRSSVLSEEEVKALATGRVFTAKQALEAKLIDSIGYLDEAIGEAAKLAGLPPDKVRVTVLGSKPSLMQAIMGVKTNMPSLSTEQMRSALLDLGVPRISYSLTTP